jgi:hypothetical protein
VFPVRYELDLYILFRRNSVFRGLKHLKVNNCNKVKELTSKEIQIYKGNIPVSLGLLAFVRFCDGWGSGPLHQPPTCEGGGGRIICYG